ncbi:hypothetical protein [Collimonas arenae]|uniref:hypothetical protein n=1 Tax=Collimonas arenae TaxID=279058 RepID=UPI00056FDE62|nr:hypothetical protein [Collimonas arenae]
MGEMKASLLVQEIDGKWHGVSWIKRYKLIPRRRSLKKLFTSKGVISQNALLIEFDAEPGQVYTVKTPLNYSSMKWGSQVINVDTKTVLSKVVGTTIVEKRKSGQILRKNTLCDAKEKGPHLCGPFRYWCWQQDLPPLITSLS